MQAAIPADEPTRLAALERTGLLDSPLEERFERITRLTCRLLGVPVAAVTLLDGHRQWFKSIHGLDIAQTPRNVSFCAHAILQEDPLIVPNAHADARFRNNPLVTGDPHIAFYAAQPVHSPDGSRIGALCAIDTHARVFTAEETQILRDMAAIAEAELSALSASGTQRDLLAQLDAERRRSLLDPMTRLWNREGILEVLERAFESSASTGEPLAVLLADVDHFKRINDTHGHAVGDRVLRETGKRLLTALRTQDAVGRFGGEEFLIVAPLRLTQHGPDVARRLVQRFAEEPLQIGPETLPLTISVGGFCGVMSENQSPDMVIQRADEALYQAKHAGRDQACVICDPA